MKTSHSHLPSFLSKLLSMLENHSNSVQWGDLGDSFIINDVQNFTKETLPAYFKHGNMNSFVRQLNMYNFKKTKVSAHIQFYHQQFRRDRQDLLHLIKRKSENKKSKDRKNQDKENHQNRRQPDYIDRQVITPKSLRNLISEKMVGSTKIELQSENQQDSLSINQELRMEQLVNKDIPFYLRSKLVYGTKQLLFPSDSKI